MTWEWWDALTASWPWMALMWPLPWMARRWMPPVSGSVRAVRIPFLVVEKGSVSSARRWDLFRAASAWVCWTLLVLASIHPQWAGDPLELPRSGRNLMLAVDLSGSMKEQDLVLGGKPSTRLDVVKKVMSPFIERRKGDRLGLILFGDQAYLQTPLTFDHRTLSQMLDESEIGLAGKRTAIGSAVGLAVKHLRQLPEGQRVLILLTDGRNTAGELLPRDALETAKETGVRIHTIGVGADEALIRTIFGMRRVNPAAELDEGLLKELAEQSGGSYFRARNTDELETIYVELDALEPVSQESEIYRPVTAIFYWPLGLAAALSLVLTAFSLSLRLHGLMNKAPGKPMSMFQTYKPGSRDAA